MITRNETKKIRIGDRTIGGGSPVAIQSMTNTRTEDVEATVAQIQKLEQAGCEIIRCAVPTMEAAEAFAKIKKQIHIPLVADIHFDYRLAIAAIENGADKIRINPGNIGGAERSVPLWKRQRKLMCRSGWRQQRVSGKTPGRKIRRCYGRGSGGERHGKGTHDRGYGI